MRHPWSLAWIAVSVILIAAGGSWGAETATGKPEPADNKAAPTGGKLAKLFILSGQSNAGGAGVGSELPPELRQTDKEVLMAGRHAKGLQPLGVYRRKGYGKDDTAFGAEITFARQMKQAFPNDIICVAKQTMGGTSIIAWDKDCDGDESMARLKLADNEQKGAQYPRLMKTIQEAVDALKKAKGVGRVEYAGVLWIQSERDDHSETTAAMYGDNLRQLIANVRHDLAAEDMPFLFADANAHRHREVIHQGMERVAHDVSRTALVPIAGLSRHGGGVHYDTQGQIELGKRFADAYLKLVRAASADAK